MIVKKLSYEQPPVFTSSSKGVSQEVPTRGRAHLEKLNQVSFLLRQVKMPILQMCF